MSISPITDQPHGQSNLNGKSKAPIQRSGLDSLAVIDELFVHQKAECNGCDNKRRFTVKNSRAKMIFWCIDNRECCARMCSRDEMKVYDTGENEVLHLYQPAPDCWSCLRSMVVALQTGIIIGSIKQEFTWCNPKFSVRDHNGDVIFHIKRHCDLCNCSCKIKFDIFTVTNDKVGEITKLWSGLAREMFTVADHFYIKFPMNLNIQTKALLLGACILLDAIYFNGNNRQMAVLVAI